MIIEKNIKKIKNSEAFVAVITENFIKEEKRLEECKIAEENNKPMYAIIADSESWKKIQNQFMWRKSFNANQAFLKEIKEDLEIIRAVKDA